ncbi:TraR/DksA C4-type zinc finger protein [Actinoplanes sp. NPDC049316]|uniref:TraR/DksA family transcriptional regulator n=1 Tax=Actinoplanes sp. NPDC049316 TaxID=3154727 RepID=UPI003433061F
MSTAVHDATHLPAKLSELLRSMLEEEFAAQTVRLTQLTVYARLPRRGGYDPRTLRALTASTRQRIADTAHALRRMSEGTYGICVSCDKPIPLGRLRAVPHAAHCALCERTAEPAAREVLSV